MSSMKSVKKILKAGHVSPFGNRDYTLLLECGHTTVRTLKWDKGVRNRKFRCMQCLAEKWKKDTKDIEGVSLNGRHNEM